jgi:signal transduction histidine kinase
MDESVLQIAIEDDGKGFCYDAPRKGGHGLIGMRARANSIGATIAWKTPLSGKGTLVELSFPLHADIERKEQL